MKLNISKQFYLYGLLSAFCCLCLAGCQSGPQPLPLNQLNAQQAHGHAVFQTYCARCHEDRNTGSLHAPALVGVFKKQYLPSGSPATDGHVTEIINDGYGPMPSIPDIGPQDLNDLLAYLHTL